MKQFQKKRKIRNLFYSKLSIAILLVVLFLLAKGTWGIYQKSQISLERKNLASDQLSELEQREEDLKKEIERLDSRVGIEEELRLRYSLSKADEKVLVIIDEESLEEDKVDEESKGFIKTIKSFFNN